MGFIVPARLFRDFGKKFPAPPFGKCRQAIGRRARSCCFRQVLLRIGEQDLRYHDPVRPFGFGWVGVLERDVFREGFFSLLTFMLKASSALCV